MEAAEHHERDKVRKCHLSRLLSPDGGVSDVGGQLIIGDSATTVFTLLQMNKYQNAFDASCQSFDSLN